MKSHDIGAEAPCQKEERGGHRKGNSLRENVVATLRKEKSDASDNQCSELGSDIPGVFEGHNEVSLPYDIPNQNSNNVRAGNMVNGHSITLLYQLSYTVVTPNHCDWD